MLLFLVREQLHFLGVRSYGSISDKEKMVSHESFHFMIWRLYIKCILIMFGKASQQAILIRSTETTFQWENKQVKKKRGYFSNSPGDFFGFCAFPSKPIKHSFPKSKHFFHCSRLNEFRKVASPKLSVPFLTSLIIF